MNAAPSQKKSQITNIKSQINFKKQNIKSNLSTLGFEICDLRVGVFSFGFAGLVIH